MLKMYLKILLLYFSVCVNKEAYSAKILGVFPTPSISHQVVFRTITQELVQRGHEVTVITTDPAYPKGKAPENLKEIDVHDISYGAWKKFLQENYKVQKHKRMSLEEIRNGTLLFSHIFQLQLQSPKVQELINNKNNQFDLLLIEAVIRPGLVYSHIFKAPMILVSSLGAIFDNHEIIGSMTHPIIFPSPLQTKIYNLTLWEKLDQLYMHYLFKYANYLSESDENAMIKQNLGPNVPPLSELYNNVHMMFININPIWADNQPVPPGVIYMGGIHQLPEKELPKDLKSYLDSSKHGVIYVSFGTNVLSGMIPPNKILMLINVLSKLPYDVLWKWDKDELPEKSRNIKTSKWLPQSDLLRHPKIKLFVTQAGLQSTDEAITAGVPLVAIPMLGDQWYNAEKYVKHGIGMNIDIDTMTEDIFKNAVETVINDESYRSNISRLRTLMRDQPESPLQRAIWWIEYILRHKGAKQLRTPSANISYSEYFELQLILIVLSAVLITLTLSVLTIVFIFRRISIVLCRKKKIKKN